VIEAGDRGFVPTILAQCDRASQLTLRNAFFVAAYVCHSTSKSH
jgi:hypothetical protein